MSSEPLIREVDIDRDAGEVVAILREASPQWIVTPEAWRYHVEHMLPEAQRRGWVADEGGEIVGFAMASRETATSEPVAFVTVTVRADRRRRGIGSRLYALVEEHTLGLGAGRLLSFLNETDDGLRFAHVRGFEPDRVAVHSVVDPASVDLARLDTLPPGVRVVSLGELVDRLEDVYAAVREAVLDEPSSAVADALGFEEFADEMRNPLTSWDGTSCTLVDDEVATFAGVLVDPEARAARNGFTGTRRGHRGRGYASLAKLTSMRWLAANGYRVLWTGNDETNEAMLAVNGRLGYRPALRSVVVSRAL